MTTITISARPYRARIEDEIVRLDCLRRAAARMEVDVDPFHLSAQIDQQLDLWLIATSATAPAPVPPPARRPVPLLGWKARAL